MAADGLVNGKANTCLFVLIFSLLISWITAGCWRCSVSIRFAHKKFRYAPYRLWAHVNHHRCVRWDVFQHSVRVARRYSREWRRVALSVRCASATTGVARARMHALLLWRQNCVQLPRCFKLGQDNAVEYLGHWPTAASLWSNYLAGRIGCFTVPCFAWVGARHPHTQSIITLHTTYTVA